MTRRDHMDRALAAALEPMLAERAAGSRPVGRPGGPLRQQVAVAVVVAVVVVAASAAALVTMRRVGSAATAPPAPTLVESGRLLRYLGPITWSDARWVDGERRRVIVVGDPYSLRTAVPNCGTTAAHPRVLRTGGTVAIILDAYAPVVPAHVACGATAMSPVQVGVTLPAGPPPDSVVDGTGDRAHDVLDPSTIPMLTRLPPGFLLRTTSWDEGARIATRIWACATRQTGSSAEYEVAVASGRTMLGTSGAPEGRVELGGHTVPLYVEQGSNGWSATVVWASHGRVYSVTSRGGVHDHRSLAELEQVARSTPVP